jgi:hypothetical protein
MTRRIQGPSATTQLQDQLRVAWRRAMEKMENKERFPLFHGTAAAICLCLKTIFVAFGI